MPTYIIAVDLGGTKLAMAIATQEGAMVERIELPTVTQGGTVAVIQQIVSMLETLVERGGVSVSDIQSVSLGFPGHVDNDTGIASHAPNLRNWERVNLRERIMASFPTPVLLGNDANLAALGEYTFGAGQGYGDLVYLTVSTGLGGGVIVNGRVLTGVGGCAGEIGHMIIDHRGPVCGCGNRGCFEVFASGTALTQRARGRLMALADSVDRETELFNMVRGDLSLISPIVIAEAAQRGDVLAAELIDEHGYYLGVGIVNLIHILDPELFIVGGGVSNIGEPLFDRIRTVVEETRSMSSGPPTPIVKSQLGADAGLMGAIALARG